MSNWTFDDYKNTLQIRKCPMMPTQFQNFSGTPTRFNPQGGRRTINIRIDDPKLAEILMDNGWNIKPCRRVDDTQSQEEAGWYNEMVINFNAYRAPSIYMVVDGHRTRLDENTVGVLDKSFISYVDISVAGNASPDDTVPGGVRHKGYVNALYAHIEIDDPFADEYADDDEIPFD